MMLFHLSFSMGLIALVAGAWLLVWISKQEGTCKGLGTVVAYVVMVLAFLSLVCMGWCSVRYGVKGYHGKSGGCMMQGVKDGETKSTP